MMPKRYVVLLFVIVLLVIAVLRTPVHAVDAKFVPSAKRGYQTLTSKAFLPADFDQQVFDDLWKSWPKELREQAEKASPVERRRMAFF